ncbi:MAG: NFACT RNA binding domain-containing protein [Oscillospiraceae bacterium]
MALDAVTINILAGELKESIVGARVDKIGMPARDEIVFSMRTHDGAKKLFISARSGSARAHLSEEVFENPAVPPSFCMLLRKHLTNARITAVEAVEGERVILFSFDALNEMGDRVYPRASLELMGRYSNFVLISGENRVIDAIKRIDDTQSDKRVLIPGVEFTLPPERDKLNFTAAKTEEIMSALATKSSPVSQSLIEVAAGIGPVVSREIALSVGDSEADNLTEAQKRALFCEIQRVKSAADEGCCDFTIVYDGKRPMEYSFINLTQYGEMPTRHFSSASQMLAAYYTEKDKEDRMKTRSLDLQKQVNALCERAVRKQGARREELADTASAEKKRLFGELINANLHELQKGMDKALLLDYYSGQTVTVPLDMQKTPAQNSQHYYKQYRKLTTAAKMLCGLLEEGEREIEYLQQVKYEITEARTEEDFLLIRKELKDAGYLRGFKYKEQKRPRRMNEFLEYKTSDGFAVLVGRNNAANEKLTLKTAEKRDIWFHIKNAAGSHTVLSCEGRTPTNTALTECAQIAAYHSSLKNSPRVDVDYTEIKNVKKAVGQKTGMVYYDTYKTATVTPDEKKVSELKKTAQR